MMEAGIEGIEIEDKVPLSQLDKQQMFVDILPEIAADDGVAYISFYLEEEEDKEAILANVKAELEEMSTYLNVGECTIEESQTEDVDWVNNWKQYFHQFYVDDVLIIPSWEEVKPEDEDKMIIHIDPGTAFGTGMHETTQLCIRQIRKYVTPDTTILDVGCGEGYYGTRLAQALGLSLTGLDISKEAVRCAAAKYKGPQWLCASAAHIPVPEGSVGLVTSLFALTLPEEYRRVLKEGGLYFQVLAAEDHLLGLKSIIYDTLTHKEKDSVPDLPGFTRLASFPIRFTFTVEGEQVQNLFSMTPHVFRIGKEGAERLRKTEKLTDTASCVLNVFRRD
jgi:SAM-dependent methyltransferase